MRVALVLGGAGSVWNDLDAALDLGEYHGIVACNDVGAAYPGHLDAWVSLHPEKMPKWTAERVASGYPWCDRIMGYKGFTKRGGIPACVTELTDFKFPGQINSGSSGLFALKVALIDLGFEKAVLCGVPMASLSGHFFDLTAWKGAISHRRGWNETLHHYQHKARSMSGWTREVLGAPDEAWLTS